MCAPLVTGMSATMMRQMRRAITHVQSPVLAARLHVRQAHRVGGAAPLASHSGGTVVTTGLSGPEAGQPASRDPLSASIGAVAAKQNASAFTYGQLVQAAGAYVSLVGKAGSMGRNELKERLAGLVGQAGLLYKADSVAYKEDRHRTPEQMVEALLKQHAAYEHKVYRPIALAADPDAGIAFVAVYYELDSIGVHMGRLPTDKISRGVLVEKLQFEAEPFRLASSLLCRPFTREEAAALEELPQGTDVTPTKWHTFPDGLGEAQFMGPPLADTQDWAPEADHMLRTLQSWTLAWNTTADSSLIDQALAPHVVMIDGYGISSDRSGRVFNNRDEAKKQVAEAQDKMINTNRVVAAAVSHDRRVGFVHWRANAKDRSSGKPVPLEGLGLHVFEDTPIEPKVECILEFTSFK